MKKVISILVLSVVAISAVSAQKLIADDFEHTVIGYSLPQYSLSAAHDGNFSAVEMDGYLPDGTVGAPALPTLRLMLTVPFCTDIQLNITDAQFDTIFLDAAPLLPMQGPQVKNAPLHFDVDDQAYTIDSFYSLPFASVSRLGIARDRCLASLVVAPMAYNPVRRQAVVCREATIEVKYVGSDAMRTLSHHQQYYSPAYTIGKGTFNQLFSSTKSSTDAPIRLVVVAPESLRCNAINSFANFKRRQGYRTDVTYFSSSQLSSTTAVTNYLQSLYDTASSAYPAPTYVIFVGDVAQMPPYDNQVQLYSGFDPHVTDLYHVTWTNGDYLPDAYFGRFSATDTTTLSAIIDKTIYYEDYNFDDDDYLSVGILVAGVDEGTAGDAGYTYGDPTMDYVARHYITRENGFETLHYYKNNTSRVPDGSYVSGSSQTSNNATRLRSLYDKGAALVNYSAHGNEQDWYKPQLNVTQVSRMSNSGRPMFVVGNCCLTNHFNTGVCLGEAFLRRGNRAGAVGYVGATNLTLWNEDFYWAVGYRSSISANMSTAYVASRRGCFDRLFHTHNEGYADWAVTAGQVVAGGNMSVESTSSSFKNYYWEVYTLMGDPSLIPVLGRSTLPSLSTVTHGRNIEITTAPYAYVAIGPNAGGNPYVGSMADSNGNLTLTLPQGVNRNDCFISVIGQHLIPLYVKLSTLDLSAVSNVAVSLYPNPATHFCTISAPQMKEVRLLDRSGRLLSTMRVDADTMNLDLQHLDAGLYIVQVFTTNGMTTTKLMVVE